MAVISLKTQFPVPDSPPVSAVISAPESGFRPEKFAMVLAHGAANDMDNGLLCAVAQGLAQAGHLVMRFNFPYREEGKKNPDPQKKLEAAWMAAFRFLQGHPHFRPAKMIAAGKSMGGRVASQLQAAGKIQAQRLVFYGYPLHATGKKDQPRGGHLMSIQAPMLFFAGTRDPLCDIETLDILLKKVQAPHALEIIEGGDHSFRILKALKMKDEQVHQILVEKTLAWLEQA